jgi:hypothetical protein
MGASGLVLTISLWRACNEIHRSQFSSMHKGTMKTCVLIRMTIIKNEIVGMV